MVIITYQEIKKLIGNVYSDDGVQIICKHDPFMGEKSFALCMIGNILALLDREVVNDKFLIHYFQGLLALSNTESQHYENFLDEFASNDEIKENALKGEKLTVQDKRVLEEIFQSNLGEYTAKSDYQKCCYSAMRAFSIAAYCILLKDISFHVGSIDIIADIDDEVQRINIDKTDEKDDIIIVEWHSTNKINNIYMLYRYRYPGLDDASVLDLVAADVIEEDYYFKDERFPIAPSILVRQYCAIIEHEVNEIIQLTNLDNVPSKHLMWYNMKEYVRDNNIELDYETFELNDLLDDLYHLRNKASHGEIITKEEYNVVFHYKQYGLFDALSKKT